MNEFESVMRLLCNGKQHYTINVPTLQNFHVIPISEDHVQVKNTNGLDLPTASRNENQMT